MLSRIRIADVGIVLSGLVLLEASTSRFQPKAVAFQLYQLLGTAFLINFLLLASWLLAIRALSGSRNGSRAIFLFACAALSFANWNKVSYRGLPILPADLAILGNWKLISNYISYSALILAFVGALACIFAVWRFPRERLGRLSAITAVLAAVLLNGGMILHRETGLDRVLRWVGVTKSSWDAYGEAWYNGLLTMILMNSRSRRDVAPDGYSRDSVRRILGPPAVEMRRGPGTKKRNLVLVMLESAFDPEVFGQMDPYPLSTLREMSREGLGGGFVTPTLGGGTANVEFEVLTGLSTRFLPSGSVAYHSHIDSRIWSLAWALKSRGYRTVAIHNWKRKFWRRDEIYPFLGIDEFYGVEDLGVPIPAVGYPDDRVVFEKAAQLLEESEQPMFLFLITMSTHGPYNFEAQATPRVRLSGSRLAASQKAEIENYATTLFHADKALGQLKGKLRSSSEEIAMVVFGDHLPAPGWGVSTFVEAGLIRSTDRMNWNLEENRKMSTTPIAFWLNRGQVTRELGRGSPYQTSPFYLTLDLLRLAGASLDDPFLRFLERQRAIAPVLHQEFMVDSRGVIQRTSSEEFSDYRHLIYDRLYGKRYSEQ